MSDPAPRPHFYIPDRDRPGIGRTDTAALTIAHDELKAMLVLVTDRLEEAITYKGDETSEWANKEADKSCVARARIVLSLADRLAGGM